MNILKQELKGNGKGFVLWSLGLVALIVAGMMEYEGMVGMAEDSLSQFISYYPPIMLALFGISSEVDIVTLSGVYWVLSYYAVLCSCIYAIMLGLAVVNRELGDKTHEFLFTKPRGRGYIFTVKLLGGLIPLTLFAVLNALVTVATIRGMGIAEGIDGEILLGCLSAYLLSLLFFDLAVLVSSVVKEGSNGGKITYTLFTLFFILGAIYDVLEEGAWLRPLVPLRYFRYEDVSSGVLPGGYLVITLVVTIASLVGGYYFFGRRDLQAV